MDHAPWAGRCGDAKKAHWFAWNVCQDAWYGAEALFLVETVIRAVDLATPGLDGPDLLAECAQSLARVRVMDGDERALLPPNGVTHVASQWFSRGYVLAPESAFAEGSAPGELSATLLPGDRIRVILQGRPFRWLTFDWGSRTVPKGPDEVARSLGLPWDPANGSVVRVEVPLEALRQAGTLLVIPTFFDVDPRYWTNPDWRARPEREHRSDEPWGLARDMRDDGAALPEVIGDVTAAGKMDAEVLGPVTFPWSTRPYLAGSAPR